MSGQVGEEWMSGQVGEEWTSGQVGKEWMSGQVGEEWTMSSSTTGLFEIRPVRTHNLFADFR